MTNTNGKTEGFVAHEKFIIDGITKQAGTLQKALLEGGMNAFEAGSSQVDFTFDENGVEHGKGYKAIAHPVLDDDGNHVEIPISDWDTDGKKWVLSGETELQYTYTYEPGAKLVISDKGRGFQSRKEINEWFQTFGTPHAESEGKKWAEFRMGRGQMFSFGHNIWRTGEFRIVFDLKTSPKERDYPADNVLDYYIEEGLPHHQGCEITITLYENPVGGYPYASLGTMKSAIKKHMEFMEGIVTFNGEQINTPASGLKWDVENDDAYFMFGKGRDLTYYNMGAYVFDRSASEAGVTGVVVSKEKLKVNFARNQIMWDCEVNKRIQEVVRDNKIKKIRKARRYLSLHERMSMLVDLRDGSGTYSDTAALGLVPLTNEKVMSLRDICKIRQPWTFAPKGDQRADTLMVRGAAVIFDEEIMQELDYPLEAKPKNFFVWLMDEVIKDDRTYANGGVKGKWEHMRRLYQPFTMDEGIGDGGLADGFNTAKVIVAEKEWTKVERRFMKVLSKHGHQWKDRTLLIGQSDTALAWTDGRSYIALDRLYIRRLSRAYGKTHAACHLVATLLHETAHDDSTVDSHHHNFGFYKAFHDIVSGNDNGCTSPMGIALLLPDELRRLEREEHQLAAEAKEKKQKAARNKALGLTVKAKPKAVVVSTPKHDGSNVIFGSKGVVSAPKPESEMSGIEMLEAIAPIEEKTTKPALVSSARRSRKFRRI